MNIRIRKALVSDIPEIKNITSKAYQKYIDIIGKKPAPMIANFSKHLEDDIFFVVEDKIDGKPIGYAIIVIKNNEYWLENIAITPDKSKQGIGLQLIKHVEDFISTRAGTYQLYTHIKMVENIKWYHRIGFKEVRRTEEDGFERVFFLKKLKK